MENGPTTYRVSVDDLRDSRHSQCDVHAGDTGEVERLQRHLGRRLTQTMSSCDANCLPRTDNRSTESRTRGKRNKTIRGSRCSDQMCRHTADNAAADLYLTRASLINTRSCCSVRPQVFRKAMSAPATNSSPCFSTRALSTGATEGHAPHQLSHDRGEQSGHGEHATQHSSRSKK